ncbi:MAG: LPS export ABC transporter periplasmic protein LptC [Candidatus Methylomirabilales bacterium]
MLQNKSMMRFLLRTAALAVALAGTVLLGTGIPIASEVASPVAPPSSPRTPDSTVHGVRMTETRKGEQLWEVEADTADVFEDRGIAILRRGVRPVRIVIHTDGETLVSFSEKAVVDLKTKDVELSGHVRSESSKGAKIFTDHLTWSASTHRVSTKSPVVIQKGGFQIKGTGMVADTILEQMIIQGRCTSRVTLSGKRERQR